MYLRSDVARYKKWRRRGKELNRKIVHRVPRELVLQAAKDLGMQGKGDTLIFDSEDETSYLMDRAIYDIKTDGKWFIEVYIDRFSKEDSLTRRERRLLQAMKECFYSLFTVEGTEPGRGIYLQDVFSPERRLFLMDINFSHTSRKGYLFATRVFSIDNLNFTGGSCCIFEHRYLRELKSNFTYLYKKKKRKMSWDEMMRRYSHYFFKKMKAQGRSVYYEDV